MTSRFAKRETFLPFSQPLLGSEELTEIGDTLASGWLTSGPKAREFEQQFAAFVGADAALALNSCTAGLHLALQVLDIGPGDEVITSGFTFAAAANVIEQSGAVPVIVDVEPTTLNIDPNLVEAAIGPNTKAILPVHFGGHPAEMDRLSDVCARNGIPVIEDAAHALGGRYNDQLVGSSGNLTAFSFYANKNMTTGEGGMLVGPKDLIEQARTYSVFGLTKSAIDRYSGEGKGSWFYQCIYPGLKYNMSDLTASIGIHQLHKLPTFQNRRLAIASEYLDAFRTVEAIECPTTQNNSVHAWHIFPIRLRLDRLTIDRDRFISEMQDRNIGCSVHFIPLPLHVYYQNHRVVSSSARSVMEEEYYRILSLPLYPKMQRQDVRDVIAAVCDIVNTFSA